MKLLSLFILSLFLVFGVAHISNQDSSLNGTEWLLHDFGDCHDILSFEDSTFTSYSCEVDEKSSGKYWTKKDSVFLYYPVPLRGTIDVNGEKKVNASHNTSHLPSLWKLIHRNDTLYSIVIINNYEQINQSLFYTDDDYSTFTQIK